MRLSRFGCLEYSEVQVHLPERRGRAAPKAGFVEDKKALKAEDWMKSWWVGAQTLCSIPSSHLHSPKTKMSLLGYRMAQRLGDNRESTFLFQRLSLAIQCFSAVAFYSTFSTDKTVCKD